MRIGVAAKAVGPGLAYHTHSGPVAARIAEMLVEFQRTGLRIEVQHEHTMFSVFSGVQNDAVAVFIGGEPVRLLFVVERNAGYFANVVQIRDVIDCDRMGRKQRLYPVVADTSGTAQRSPSNVLAWRTDG